VVHHIQARLAWEDTETWEPATVIRVHPPLITIRDSGGEIRVYRSAEAGHVGQAANDGTRSVHITERWRILAVVSETGQVIAVPQTEPREPGSIFVLSGAEELRFVSIARVEEGDLEPDE
jgi:hypothetical protein